MSTLIRPLVPTMEFGLRLKLGRIPNSIGLLFLALLMSVSSYAQPDSTLSCYGRVNMSLSKSGVINLKPYQLTGRRNTSSLIVDLPDRTNTQLDCRDLNQVIMVALRDTVTGIVCMNEVLVEDKSPYDITCNDGVVSCIQSLDALDPADFITVIDNCTDINDLSVTYTDTPGRDFPDGSDTLREIIRVWSTTDVTGLVRNCESSIFLTPLDIFSIQIPSDTIIYCGQNPLDTAITGGIAIDLSLLTNGCDIGLTTNIVGSPQVHSCGAKTKYIREWRISDWYTGSVRSEIQSIVVEDTIKPQIVAPTTFEQVVRDCQVGIVFGPPTIDAVCSVFSVDNVEILFGTMSPAIGDTIFVDPGTYRIIYRGDGACPNAVLSDTAQLVIADLIVPTLVCSDDLNKAISIGDRDSLPVLLDSVFASADITACGDFQILGRKVGGSPVFTPALTLYLDEAPDKLNIEIVVRSDSGFYSDTCSVWIDVQEKVLPLIDLETDLIVTLGADGMIEIDTSVIIASLSDNTNCFNSITYTGSGTLMPTGSGIGMKTGSLSWFTDGQFQTFDCGDVGTYLLKVEVLDCDNNMAMDTATVVIEDGGNCPMMATVSGGVMAYGYAPISGVSVSAYNGDNGYVSNTDLDGNYVIENLNGRGTYNIEVALADIWEHGLTAYDLSLLKHYILGIEELDMYQLASGDVDNSGDINVHDVIALQKIILKKKESITGTVLPWLFSNKTLHGELVPFDGASYNIDRPLRLDWEAVKRGDLDGDVITTAKTRASQPLNVILVGGDEYTGYTYAISMPSRYLTSAFQLSLNTSDTKMQVIESHDEIIIDQTSEHLSMIYYNADPSNGDDELAIQVKTSGLITASLLDNYITAQAWSLDGIPSSLYLEISEELQSNASSQQLSITAYPNPTTGNVSIDISHLETTDSPAIITVSDAVGRIYSRETLNLSANERQLNYNINLPAPVGLYVITVQAADNQLFTRVMKK